MRGVADAKRPAAVRVLVYSNDADTRSQVMLALGRRPHPELPPIEYVEVATGPIVVEQVDDRQWDLLILDGESAPTGGLGLAKQLKDEISDCPPIVVLTGRPDDAWLANWSRAEAAVSHPIDPIRLTDAVLGVLRNRSAA
ncbi:response regulator transcription factor [Nocardia huaxiensis]|uniref:Response regulator transcription factor n=1 Tax=Nocardia huaxiensis TaxID=2755382 RepID=A0A7D6VAU5_9NOCA|nr:response regulator transcription factor [Nocardia huaxiensis]QLY28417.1 response regulator transcription factor [Nocardia huaxiensis]